MTAPTYAPLADAAARRDWLRLIRSENIGPVTFTALMRRYRTPAKALEAAPTLSARGGREIVLANPTEIEAELAAGERLGARLITLADPDYPPLLARIHAAPPALWVLGDPALLSRQAVGIVGARNASALGCRLANRLAADLGARGYVVVSGMARGIDTAALEGALKTGAVAVLGGGVDNIYPPGAEALHARLCAEGAVVSENPVGYEPKARDFPRRNRIIAGLALGVVAAEAAERSGSLITARLALEENREVMAVPGSPFDPRAGGCNHLLRQGATLVRHAADVIEALETTPPLKLEEPPEPPFAPPAVDTVSDAMRSRIVELLGPAPVEVDDLIRRSGASPGEMALVLLELDLAGRLFHEPGGRVALAPE